MRNNKRILSPLRLYKFPFRGTIHSFLILIVVITISCSCRPGSKSPEISIDNTGTEMPFIGLGVQWSAYHHADCKTAEWGHLMTDKKWQMNFERLDFMKPRIIRVLDQANWRYLKGFSSEGEAILDFESPEMQALYTLLDYCESKNIIVLLGEWGAPYQVHDLWRVPEHASISGANDPQWIDMIVKHLDYLVNTKHYTCIRYYNLINEPNGSWASTDGKWEEWREGIQMLYEEIKEAGLDRQITIAGPDAVPGKHNSAFEGAEWLMKCVDEIDTLLGCYDVHSYPRKEDIFSGKFAEYYAPLAAKVRNTGKPIIFGELGSNRNNQENKKRIDADPCAGEDSQMEVYDFQYGIQMADACIQAMNMGFGSLIAWDLDDAMHTVDDAGEKTQLKRWGMWNSLGTELCNDPSDENIRPWFFPWSLLCQYFLPGSTIIPVESGNEKVHIIVGRMNSEFTIAITNTGEEKYSFVLKEENGPLLKKVSKYLYDEHFVTDSKGFPVPVAERLQLDLGKGSSMSILPQSFILLTTIEN